VIHIPAGPCPDAHILIINLQHFPRSRSRRNQPVRSCSLPRSFSRQFTTDAPIPPVAESVRCSSMAITPLAFVSKNTRFPTSSRPVKPPLSSVRCWRQSP